MQLSIHTFTTPPHNNVNKATNHQLISRRNHPNARQHSKCETAGQGQDLVCSAGQLSKGTWVLGQGCHQLRLRLEFRLQELCNGGGECFATHGSCEHCTQRLDLRRLFHTMGCIEHITCMGKGRLIKRASAYNSALLRLVARA